MGVRIPARFWTAEFNWVGKELLRSRLILSSRNQGSRDAHGWLLR